MPINMDSILAKAKAAIKTGNCKERYDDTVRKIMLGSIKLKSGTLHTPEEAADKFIEVLLKTINSSGLSANAQAAISNLAHTAPVALGDGTYRIGVYFNENLSRPSLDEARYGGITDLAELFDHGMTTKSGKPVHGVWHGQEIWSRTVIPGTGFMDAAVADFMGNYASEYNVISCTATKSFS